MVVIVVVRTVIGIGLKRLGAIASKTETDIDDLVSQLLEKTKFLFVALVALYAGALSLTLPPGVDDLLSAVLVLGFLIQGAFWASGIVNYMIDSWAREKFDADPAISTAPGSVGFLMRCSVWAIFVMLALDNMGINVGPLVASLGIGGVALALALQGVLGDLFASLSIIFDKPFVVGDSIRVGIWRGPCSTSASRLRESGPSLGSSWCSLTRIFSAAGFRISNTGESAAANSRFERCLFMVFGDSALNFETVYHMLVPDFQAYGDTHHAINLEIFRRFGEEEIEFADPTHKVYFEGEFTGAQGGS